jgi:hypothetical protein
MKSCVKEPKKVYASVAVLPATDRVHSQWTLALVSCMSDDKGDKGVKPGAVHSSLEFILKLRDHLKAG